MAHHFVAAVPTGTADKAVDYARRAAQRAERVLAHDEAVGHWELALSALASKWSDYQEQRYQILLGLGEARRWAGDVTGAAAAVEEAVDIALRLDDPVRAARAAVVFGGVALWNLRAYGVVNVAMVERLASLLTAIGTDHPELRAQLLGTLAVELYYSDERARREASAAEAVELARGVGDARLLGQVLNNAYLAQWTADREVQRRAITEEALALVGRGLPRQTEVIARIHRMWSLLRRGESRPTTPSSRPAGAWPAKSASPRSAPRSPRARPAGPSWPGDGTMPSGWPPRPAAGCRPPACGGRSGANRCSSSPCAASRGASTSCFPACWPAARSRAASR